ncbi:MAG: hypothetical protein AMS25_07390 [Gemmatimonas sp. SM23_52]|nr:MAG: hypothetical protein AMS25_07390 [Gemmatimonas sp. SM23_52]
MERVDHGSPEARRATSGQLLFALRVVALALVLFASLRLVAAVADALFPLSQPGPSQAPIDESGTAPAWLLVCFLYALVLAYPIVRARWSGWRLVAAIFLVFYGIVSVLTWIEVAVFMAHVVPDGLVARTLAFDALGAAVIAPLAALLFGKLRALRRPDEENRRLVIPVPGWAWRLAVIAVSYVFLYSLFGALVAWRAPAVREYYAELAMPSPSNIMLLQVVRAMIWVAIALPVIRMMKGPWWQTSLAVGLLFAVLMNAGLLVPNPLMPEAVRMTHLVETATSNFIFGFFMAWLLLRPWARAVALSHAGSTASVAAG